MNSMRRLFGLLKGNTALFFAAVVSTALAAGLSLLTPLIVKYAVDTVINKQPSTLNFANFNLGENGLLFCALAIFFVTIINGTFAYLKGRFSAIASENIAQDLKQKMYVHLQRLPFEYHVKAQAGDLIQRATSDVDTVRRFLQAQVIELGRILFLVCFSLFFMFKLNVSLTLSSIVIMPFLITFSVYFAFEIRKSFLRVDEKEGQLSTVLNESLSGVRVVRAFGREEFETAKFEEKNSEFRGLVYKMISKMAIFWGVSDFLCLSQIGIVLFLGLTKVHNNEISVGTLLVFTSYVAMLLWPIRGLGRLLSDMGKMTVSLTRIFEILETPCETDMEKGLTPPLNGDIVFSNVQFCYDDNVKVLDNLSFAVKQGQTIAILGGTGSGKSTIMHLLLRLYDCTGGTITIGGVDISTISKRWLRENIGIVLQEPFLYSKTIMDNIKMAKSSATEDEIFEATKIAAIHSSIKEFEKSYDTQVGERGVTLSGGQKQRLAIARTLIKSNDILIFDDSLSAVDTQTDLQIRQALAQQKTDSTTFIISQRVSTIMDATKILVIENGKLADFGTHEELISRDGLYLRIWTIQRAC